VHQGAGAGEKIRDQGAAAAPAWNRAGTAGQKRGRGIYTGCQVSAKLRAKPTSKMNA